MQSERTNHKPQARIDIVTPEMARKWLENNTANRPVSPTTVAQYGRDMALGKWLLTGEVIQFGTSGRLLNGQHRLLACIQSDTPFTTMVVRNIAEEDDVMDVIDTGKKRTFGGALTIHGERDANNLSGVINLCWRYEKHRLSQSDWPTHADSFAWLAANPDVRQANGVAAMVYKQIHAQRAPVGAAFYLNARIDNEAANEFWNLASTGEGLEAESAILAYRRWVIGTLARRERPIQKTWLAYALKAMLYWREGRKVRLLSIRPSEPMPEPWA